MKSIGRRASIVGVLAVCASAILPGTARPAAAVGVLEVSISVDSGTKTIGTAAPFEVTVSNSGTDPLTNLTLVSADIVMLTEVGVPTVLVGNGDDVLDPGEQWRYAVVGWYWMLDSVAVTVSAIQADTTPVSTTAIAPVDVAFAMTAILVDPPTTFVPGDQVTWTIATANVSLAPILPRLLTRVLDSAGLGGGPFVDLPGPVQGDADSDGVLDPGESWLWTYSSLVRGDQSLLDTSILYDVVDGPGRSFLSMLQSPPLTATVPAPTTPTTDPLPAADPLPVADPLPTPLAPGVGTLPETR